VKKPEFSFIFIFMYLKNGSHSQLSQKKFGHVDSLLSSCCLLPFTTYFTKPISLGHSAFLLISSFS
jgi:hypothetical protein